MSGAVQLIIVAIIAFLSSLLNTVSGGGFGTIFTPSLVLLGYDLKEAVVCSLISQITSNISVTMIYHRFGVIMEVGIRRKFYKDIFLMSVCGLIGVLVSLFLLVNLPYSVFKIYTGLMVMLVGLLVLTIKREIKEETTSAIKLAAISIVSAFNKCVSGGGFGPLLSGGQVLSGIKVKSALIRTFIVEMVVCAGGLLIYLYIGVIIDAYLLLTASLCSAVVSPLSVRIIRSVSEDSLRKIMGMLITILGIAMLLKVSMTF